MERVFFALPGLGMCIRRTAGARYRPDLNRSSRLARFASNSASYCAAVTPSIPAAPSLRVRRYASRNHATSMWRANVVSTRFGSIRASSASFSCRVEMISRPNVPVICPSRSPIIRPTASLHPVPLGRVPRPPRYYQWAPTPRLPSRLASLPSRRATTRCPSFAPRCGTTAGAWTTSTAAPAPPTTGGENKASQVPGRPLPACPALRPRRTAYPRPARCKPCSLPLT